MNPATTYVIEWSNSQKRFHIQTLEQSLAANLEAMQEGRIADYITVALATNSKEAHDLCDELKVTAKGYVPIPF